MIRAALFSALLGCAGLMAALPALRRLSGWKELLLLVAWGGATFLVWCVATVYMPS
jgi:DMSO reductase anchor subunit